ncbi:hypothetical protein [Hymenobacter rubidus]|uniref:hypothetical protein n=1 Tax=Hymenobacter rubidus TaxID=1441626 RepID=UPI00191FA956|nr:hypothetical protein [Hymenobacter rubidus]
MIALLPLGRKVLIGALLVFCAWYTLSDYLFDEDNITHLAGRYYTANYDDGVALHWYDDADSPYSDPLLEAVYATQVGGKYLVARTGIDSYFIFPVDAKSNAEAQKGKRGPFLKAELMNKLLQLNGDTLLRTTGPF